jgi:hypothetical protein
VVDLATRGAGAKATAEPTRAEAMASFIMVVLLAKNERNEKL